MNFENLLSRIMNSDVNIRHSIVTDADGNILATNHRSVVAEGGKLLERKEGIETENRKWTVCGGRL